MNSSLYRDYNFECIKKILDGLEGIEWEYSKGQSRETTRSCSYYPKITASPVITVRDGSRVHPAVIKMALRSVPLSDRFKVEDFSDCLNSN